MRPTELGDDHFRVLPALAGADFPQRFEYYRHLFAYLTASRRLPHQARVLELGSGAGYGAAVLRAQGIEFIATDLVLAALQYAQRIYDVTPGVQAPATALPFHCNMFDAVIAFQVIEHVHDVDAMLREIRRLLRPGGYLILTTPNRTLRLLPLQKPWNPYHVREYRAAELKRLLRRYFKQVTVQGISTRPDLLQRERLRVRQRPLYVYGGMLRRRLGLARPARRPDQSFAITAAADNPIDVTARDFCLTENVAQAIDLFGMAVAGE
jgi:SAM-dependent methyltransferase